MVIKLSPNSRTTQVTSKKSQINNDLAREKFRETMRLKREKRLRETYELQKMVLPLSDRELEIAGYFLYWGEGAKRLNGQLRINNTDPKVVKFCLYWLTQVLRVPKERIRVELHLYKDMNVSKEMDYWSKQLDIPLTQFAKPYIKDSNRNGLNHKGFGHGTCGLRVGDTFLKEWVLMGIAAVADYYSSKI